VLAHEITHVTQRHMARAATKEKNQFLYMLASARAGDRRIARRLRRRRDKRRQLRSLPGQALALQSQINFTRENEYEADRIGFQRLEARASMSTRWRR
jgi:predicted Zn-dependent protease